MFSTAGSRAARQAIKRRARALAEIAEQAYIDTMDNEWRHGMLPLAGIDFWQPAPGTRVMKMLDRVRHELDACRGVAAILIP